MQKISVGHIFENHVIRLLESYARQHYCNVFMLPDHFHHGNFGQKIIRFIRVCFLFDVTTENKIRIRIADADTYVCNRQILRI